uniref:Reverse transcriptase domain-containing protein n=1 Tax=Tanacetum cinerariifolium TaxID=118510 RepID=A0A6L2NS39_TANCI|nr:reverse transcriptase domain-containing protein [Tanacetum cinerariifolium]
MQTTHDLEEPSHQEFETGAAVDQPIAEASRHPEWFQQQKKPPTPNRDWNKTLPATHKSIQPWISELAKQADSRSSFNELMDTPADFSAFLMNRLKFDTLTPELLAGPTYKPMKGSCKSLVELEFFREEVYKATTDQLNWNNPKGQPYPHNLLKPLPLIPNSRGRRVIPFDHFINNDLEYLRGGALCIQTRSSSRLVSNPSSILTPSTNPNLKGRNRRRSKQRIEEFNLDELSPLIVTMADQRTMAQLLQAPTKGYEDEIVVPAITADNFELKHGLLTLVQNKQFKDLLRACPHHGFSELHQLDTLYNALNSKDQDSLNSVAGGNFFDKMPGECLAIIESKSKVCYLRNKPVVVKVSTNPSTSSISPDIAELKDMVKALLLDKKSQDQSPAPVKAVEESCVNCGGPHSYHNCSATDGNVYRDNIQEFISQASAVNYNQGNTIYRPLMMSNQIRPPGFPPVPNNQNVVENEPEATKGIVNPTNNGITEDVQPQVVQSESLILTSKPVTSPISEPVISPVIALKHNPKTSILYPSRRNDERNREKANNQIEKFYQIFKDMSFEISFADALILTPKFASTLKALIGNKEKLSDMARTPLNKHCSAVLLKKLPKKLGDPGKLSIPNLTPTYMTLELADHSISHPVGVAEDVYVKVGSFHFSADFIVVDFDADPRVPLIIRRSFLKTGIALIDVFEGELTLRVGKEAITFNLDQTLRYSANYNDMTTKRIDVIDMTCEEYSQEILVFFYVISIGNPTPYYDPIVSKSSLTLTPFGNNDFLLEEVDAFLAIEDDPTSELNICEAKSEKSSVDEPPEVELKDLPHHLEYEFLEGDNKFSIIIEKDLSVEEMTALIMVLKSHKRAIAWKLSDIEGIDPEFCTHKIIMEEDFEPAVQHQRRVNPKIHDVIKQEVIKLLEAGLIYPISDSPWVSPVHCVPKKGGFTVVENEDNELIPTRLVTGWRVCIDYRKLNEATRKDHFPLQFMDQMLERLAGNQYYCFLDGFFRLFPNSHRSKRSGENHIHLPIRNVCLSSHAFWAMQCSRHVSKEFFSKLSLPFRKDAEEEKIKRLHDSKIKDRVFNIGDKVLLFNSRLNIFSAKLKSRWSGPFTISQVYPYGTVELSQPDGPNFKVSGHRLKHYFREDVPKLVVPDLQTFPRDH